MVANAEKRKVAGIAATIPVGTQPPGESLVMAAAMTALLLPVLAVICMQRRFVHGLVDPGKCAGAVCRGAASCCFRQCLCFPEVPCAA